MHDLAFSMASQSHQSIIIEILEDARAWLKTKGINQWPFPFTSEWVNKCLDRQEFFLANVDHVTVAVFRLLNTDPFIWDENTEDAIYIHSLAVRRSWQGREIGSVLLRWVEDYAVQNHRPFLRLDCMAENSALCQYYEQAGFVACRMKEIQIREFLYKAQLFEKAVGPYKVVQQHD
jgi:GNAT superfamily N-acetyltransferase